MSGSINTSDGEGGREVSDPVMLVKNPTVSVLMLAYNHGPYLAQAIEGVLAQRDDVSIELLIGEDFSTDNTKDIALQYQLKFPEIVRVFEASKNVGPTLNHRRILLAARGAFYAYLDGDDYWMPGKLLQQVSYLQENQKCAAVYTNALTIDENGCQIGIFNDVANGTFNIGELLARGNFLNTSSMVYRSNARDTLLGIDRPSIDYHVHLLLAQDGFLQQIGTPLTVYRLGSTGSMVSTNNEHVRQLYWEAIISVPRALVSDRDLACGIADFLRRVIFRSLRARRISLLRKWVPVALAASPFGIFRTSSLVAVSVIRISFKELIGYLLKDVDSRRVNVLYRH